jgi:hypothetical protein
LPQSAAEKLPGLQLTACRSNKYCGVVFVNFPIYGMRRHEKPNSMCVMPGRKAASMFHWIRGDKLSRLNLISVFTMIGLHAKDARIDLKNVYFQPQAPHHITGFQNLGRHQSNSLVFLVTSIKLAR